MNWTDGQRGLRELAVRPARGCEINIVQAEHRSGVTQIVQALARGPREPVRCLHVFAAGLYEAVANTAFQAGTPMRNGYGASLALALKALAGDDGAPVCLLLDSAEELSARGMQRFVLALEWAAQWERVATRAVLLCRPIQRWDNPSQTWMEGWPRLPEAFKHRRVTVYNFCRQELEKLAARDMPKGLFEEAA